MGTTADRATTKLSAVVAEAAPAASSAGAARPAADEAATPVTDESPTSATEPAAAEPAVVELAACAPQDRVGAERVTGERTEAWAKLIADPGHAPELLALAAVQSIGPRARDWAARTRESYPTVSDRALARLATRQFTRFGSLGSIFGAAAGSYAPLTLLGTAAVTHAEVVLHLAAAYGLDPTDPERAVDLLVITRVHPTRSDAEAAFAAARRPAYEDGGLSDAVWRFGRMMAAQTGGWAALRLASRFLPGTSLLAAFLAGTASAQSVAARAESYYKAARTPTRGSNQT